jgi:hypothetical protein
VWDIRRAVETLRRPEVLGSAARSVHLAGERNQAVNALYASLFTADIPSLELFAPASTHRSGPDYLNVLRFLDIPQALAMVAEQRTATFSQTRPDAWKWTSDTARALTGPRTNFASDFASLLNSSRPIPFHFHVLRENSSGNQHLGSTLFLGAI